MSAQTSIPLKRDPKKVKSVFAYWKKLILKSQDCEHIALTGNLPTSERMQLEKERMTLRKLIARCSSLKVSVHRNIIFQ